jgi:copper chaperone NosL
MIKRVLLILAGILLIGVYFFPIWEILFYAPQYPEGLGMLIHVNKITGLGEHDIEIINDLNHYIGMKTIEENSIPELKIMPFILAFLIIYAFIAAIINKKLVTLTFSAIITLLGIAGLVDFYLWEYDYGHNLAPNAPIKIDPFQPAFIGHKSLLNFDIYSFPHIGGALLGLAIVLAWLSTYLYFKEGKK